MPDKKLKVFVNYRRADDKIFVELLRTHFMFRYGQENVFMDFDSIPPFTNFEEFIRQAIQKSDVVAMMIGRHWTELMQTKAANGETDYVLLELEEALQHDKVIAPICMLGANMPIMPSSLKPISAINAQFVSDGIHLVGDVTRIMDGFEAELERRGVVRLVSNPTSTRRLQSAQTADRTADIRSMLSRFTEAVTANDLLQALIWIGQLRASGQAMPSWFNLVQQEAELKAKLQETEDRQRRREVADFQYQYVRTMLALNAPAEEIKREVEAIRKIDPGYVPADLATEITRLMFTLPLLEWITIPTGKITIAGIGMFEVTEFAISKYPVTNAQYQAFIDDGGYRDTRWWEGLPQRAFGPTASRWTESNCPRETVSWYETMAFCRWLSAKLGQTVTLPTEMQWQRAAQGDNGWEYPWGNYFDKTWCNTKESGIRRTTPVDHYSQGKSPFGIFDMAGNVWEWCLNDYNNLATDVGSEANRALKGGSWVNGAKDARVAHRDNYNPNNRDYYVGFRVVRDVRRRLS